MKKMDFWFDYASTYTYLSVARIAELSKKHDFEVIWKPFFLTAIFAEAGLPEGPFMPYPNKLKYMWRDIERRSKSYGLPYKKPSDYPFNSLIHARIGCLAAAEGWCDKFTKAIFNLHWVDGLSMTSEENIARVLQAIGQDPRSVFEKATSNKIKEGLKLQTSQAKNLGIFGSPTFIVKNEIFWGDDRLDDAIQFFSYSSSG